MSPFRFLIAALCGLAISGCSSRSAIDTVQLSPEDDVFLGQSPYGLDSSVVVLAKVPAAKYQGGAIVLTGGRELLIVQPHAWRGYTGTAVTTEEAGQRTQRAAQTGVASERVSQALSDLNRELQRFKGQLQDDYQTKAPPSPAPEHPVMPTSAIPVEADSLRTNSEIPIVSPALPTSALPPPVVK